MFLKIILIIPPLFNFSILEAKFRGAKTNRERKGSTKDNTNKDINNEVNNVCDNGFKETNSRKAINILLIQGKIKMGR